MTSSFVAEPTRLLLASTGSRALPALCHQSTVSSAALCREKVSALCWSMTSRLRHRSATCVWRRWSLRSTCWWRHQANHVTTSMRPNRWVDDSTSLSTVDVYMHTRTMIIINIIIIVIIIILHRPQQGVRTLRQHCRYVLRTFRQYSRSVSWCVRFRIVFIAFLVLMSVPVYHNKNEKCKINIACYISYSCSRQTMF